MADQGARVDPGDDGHAGGGEKILRSFVRAPVARQGRELADDLTFDERLERFVVSFVRAIIADLRVSQDHDLAGIGRIGEDFLISGNGGIEDDFTRPLDGRTITVALEDGAVFQGEDCGVQVDWIPPGRG